MQLLNNSYLRRINFTIIFTQNPLEVGTNEDGRIFFFHKAVTSRAALLMTTVIEIYINQKNI